MSKEAMKFDSNAVNLFKNVYGVAGGGVTPVDVLPERGEVGTMYQTPDGNLYYWAVKSHKVINPATSLEVGKTYALRSSIPMLEYRAGFHDIFDNGDADITKNIEASNITSLPQGLSIVNVEFHKGEVNTNYCIFSIENFPVAEADEPKHLKFDWNDVPQEAVFPITVEDTPSVNLSIRNVEPPYEITITQELVNKFAEAAQGSCTLNDFAFLFVGEETVVIDKECYIQLSGIYIDYDALYDGSRAVIYDDTEGYNAQIIYDTIMAGGNAIIKYTGKGTNYAPLYYFYLQPQLGGGEVMILVSNFSTSRIMIAPGFNSGAKNYLDFGKPSSREDSSKEKEEIVEKEPTKE